MCQSNVDQGLVTRFKGTLTFTECVPCARPCARPLPYLSLTHRRILFGRCYAPILQMRKLPFSEVKLPVPCLTAGRLNQDGNRISYPWLHNNLTHKPSGLKQHTFIIPPFLSVRSTGMAELGPLLKVLPVQICS